MKFVWFHSKIYNLIDSKRQKKFEKFDNFQFEIRSIRKKIIRKIRKFFKFSFPIRKIWQKIFLTIFRATICNLQHYFNSIMVLFLQKGGQNNIFFHKNVWLWKNCSFYLQFAKKIVGKNSKKIRMNSKKFEKLLDWKFEIRFDSKAK